MLDRESLTSCLISVQSYHDTKTSRQAIETLLKIHRNILKNPDDPKFRKIKLDNKAFQSSIWSLNAAREFMVLCGWFEIHNTLVFKDDSNLMDIINLLLEHRVMMPAEEEWEEETKVITKSKEQSKEEELRKAAAVEREKELEEFMKEKREREQLARDIKAQIVSDHSNRKFYTQPAVANKLERGAKIKTLNSPDNQQQQ